MLTAHFVNAIQLVRGYWNTRRLMKLERKDQLRRNAYALGRKAQLGITRARLKKLQNTDFVVLPFHEDVAKMSDEALEFYGALLLDPGDPPYPSLDEITGK